MKFPFPWLFWAQLSTQHRTYGFDVIIQRGHKVQSADQQLLRCLNVYLHSITGLKHKYTKKLKLYIYIIYIYVFVFTYMPKFPAMIAHLNHRSCQKTMFPLRDKRSQEEAGGRRRAEEKRQSWEMCVRPLSVIYHHPTISAALWVPLTVCGNLTLSACPALFLQY